MYDSMLVVRGRSPMLARFLLATALLAVGCGRSPVFAVPAETNSTESGSSAESAPMPQLIAASVPPPRPAWSDDVDFLALREAYGAREDFEERCDDVEVSKSASAALGRESFLEVVELTRAPLEACPVWAQLHLWRAAALLALDREAEGETHKRWFLGLTDSILATGDGKTPETPFITISIPEEYATLARLGLTPRRQALVEGPSMLDLITAEDEFGKTRSIYFSPSWHFIRLISRIDES